MEKILITGSSGTIGSQLVSRLVTKPNIDIKIATRSAHRPSFEGVALGQGTKVESVLFDYDKPDTMRSALTGVDRLFLLTPGVENQVAVASTLVDLAKSLGVKHVVKLSAYGAEIEPGIQLGRWHRAVEKHIEQSGVAWTHLRPNNFFENFINYYPPQKDGNIYLPWGAGACSFVGGNDVADVAANVLTSSGHEGMAYSLTGPDAFTIKQAASAIAEVTGRQVTYVDIPEVAARNAMVEMGLEAWFIESMMELHRANKEGRASDVNDAVPRLLGRKATPFLAFAKQHAAAWK